MTYSTLYIQRLIDDEREHMAWVLRNLGEGKQYQRSCQRLAELHGQLLRYQLSNESVLAESQ